MSTDLTKTIVICNAKHAMMTKVRTLCGDFVAGSWIILMSHTESKQKSKQNISMRGVKMGVWG